MGRPVVRMIHKMVSDHKNELQDDLQDFRPRRDVIGVTAQSFLKALLSLCARLLAQNKLPSRIELNLHRVQ